MKLSRRLPQCALARPLSALLVQPSLPLLQPMSTRLFSAVHTAPQTARSPADSAPPSILLLQAQHVVDPLVPFVVDKFLNAPLAEQEAAVKALHWPSSPLPPDQLLKLLLTLSSAPQALECLYRIRELGRKLKLGEAFDKQAAVAIRSLLRDDDLTVVQLPLHSSNPYLQKLKTTALEQETVLSNDDLTAIARRFAGKRRMVCALTAERDAPGDLLAVVYSAILPGMPSSFAQLEGLSGDLLPGVGPAAVAAAKEPYAPQGEAQETPIWSLADGGLKAAAQGGAESRAAEAELPATTAVFYSISTGHAGTRGLSMGTKLIYKLASAVLTAAGPEVNTLCTLSPIPGFMAWLRAVPVKGISASAVPEAGSDGQLGDGTAILFSSEEVQRIYSAAGALKLLPVGAGTAAGVEMEATQAQSLAVHSLLLHCLQKPEWVKEGKSRAALRPLLLRLARQYLLSPSHPPPVVAGQGGSRGKGSPACKVANFHLGNGARMARLLFAGDESPLGLQRSAGLMVNYSYAAGNGWEGLQETMTVRAQRFLEEPLAVLKEQKPV